MPAKAGIQSVVNINNFKNLDSRFCGMAAFPPIATQSLQGEDPFLNSADLSVLCLLCG
jgi:hypothetical protein